MGFGNRLFPWARCRIFADINSAQMIAPVWLRPAIGQLFRGGNDYHSYIRQLILFGLFHRRSNDFSFIRGLIKTKGILIIQEPEILGVPYVFKTDNKDVIVIFSGYEHYFAPFNNWYDYLYKELRLITKFKYLKLADSFGDIPIAICVRCGNDFGEPVIINGKLQKGQKTPLTWFVRCLNIIRNEVKYSCKAVVISDGTHRQLEELLSLENVQLIRPASAISDLLVLSKASVLIGSGSSSFVAWGCFLGQMPSISHPGQSLLDWGIVPKKGQYIGEFDPSKPTEEFLSQVRVVLR
jgi:hypothetical protein